MENYAKESFSLDEIPNRDVFNLFTFFTHEQHEIEFRLDVARMFFASTAGNPNNKNIPSDVKEWKQDKLIN